VRIELEPLLAERDRDLTATPFVDASGWHCLLHACSTCALRLGNADVG